MRTAKFEAAISAIIESGDKPLLEVACYLAERLPKGRQRKALRKIVWAI